MPSTFELIGLGIWAFIMLTEVFLHWRDVPPPFDPSNPGDPS